MAIRNCGYTNDELAMRMVRLGELSVGEVSFVAYEIGRRLREGTNRRGAEDAEEAEEEEGINLTAKSE